MVKHILESLQRASITIDEDVASVAVGFLRNCVSLELRECSEELVSVRRGGLDDGEGGGEVLFDPVEEGDGGAVAAFAGKCAAAVGLVCEADRTVEARPGVEI